MYDRQDTPNIFLSSKPSKSTSLDESVSFMVLISIRRRRRSYGLDPVINSDRSASLTPLQSKTIRVAESARDLGVVIDFKLSLSAHVAALCRSGFYHLHQLHPVFRSLTHEATRTLVLAFISSRLDYCNSLLYGLPHSLIRKVQSVHAEFRPSASHWN